MVNEITGENKELMETEGNMLSEETAPADAASEEDSLIIPFRKPFEFEHKTYTEIDLTGLENLKGRDIIAACRRYSKGGNISVAPQLELPFTIDIAARANGLPIEFFENLSPAMLFKVHSTVVGFFGREE